MGIYNIIALKNSEKCPHCGAEMTEFQTKQLKLEGYPIINGMINVKLNSRMDGEMHTSCEQCGKWVTFVIKKGKAISTASDDESLAK